MKKIVIASDSFKGSLTSQEVADAVAHGIMKAMASASDTHMPEPCDMTELCNMPEPCNMQETKQKTEQTVADHCEIIELAIADGGEGTTEALAAALGATFITIQVHDPLGRPIEARYAIIDYPINGQDNNYADRETQTSQTNRTAIIEMSAASGLTLLSPEERNPLLTSTYGTGELILDAIRKGCTRFLIGIGGSATNDGGTGMLEALGFRFIDKDDHEITGMNGGRLSEIAAIVKPTSQDRCKHGQIGSTLHEDKLANFEFITACDVDTPFCGPDGATAVFSAQKGATPEMQIILEKGMQNLNRIIAQTTGIELSIISGTGAAGGLGGALYAFMNSELKSGIDMVLDTIGFDEIIKEADLIITGEGRIDSQTGKGKAAAGVLKRASKAGVPVLAIAGMVDMTPKEIAESGFAAVLPIGPKPQNESDLEHAMLPEVASENISNTVSKALVSLFPSWFRVNP